jgi:S1-C subfamily serine protease
MPVETIYDYVRALGQGSPRDVIRLTVEREGIPLEMIVELGEAR